MVIGRGRRREHLQPTFCTTTKTKRGKKPGISRTYFRTEPLPVTSVWRHFRSNLYYYSSNKKDADMRRTYFRSGPLPNRDSSGRVTWSLPVKKVPLGRILCNFRLRMRRTYLRTGQVNDIISGHMTYVISGHVTSGSTSQNLRKCGLSCTLYTTRLMILFITGFINHDPLNGQGKWVFYFWSVLFISSSIPIIYYRQYK